MQWRLVEPQVPAGPAARGAKPRNGSATCAHSPIEFRHSSLRAKAQSLADFAGGKAQEQHGSVKRAVRNTLARLPIETVDQLLPDLTGLGGGVGAARKQRQQIRGARHL